MKVGMAWLLFGVPLGAALVAAVGLYRNWGNEHDRITKVLAIIAATSAALLGCGATAYVQFVRSLPAFDYSVEELGFLLSASGPVLGAVTLRSPRWFTSVALGVSTWMLVWFFLLGSTY